MQTKDKQYIETLCHRAMLKGKPSESSLEKYKVNIDRFMTVMKVKKVEDLTRLDFENFIIKMRKRGRSSAYIASVLSAMRWLLFRYEKEFGRINDIVANDIVRPHIEGKEVVVLTDEEMRKFFAVIESDISRGSEIRRFRFQALIAMLIQTGGRIGEVLSINIDDIDRENKEVRVIGKGNKERTLHLLDNTLQAVDNYLELRTDKHEALFVALNRESRWQQTDVNRTFKRYRQASGIKKKFTNHTLRHTFATYLLNKGVPINTIQHLLGHSSPMITMKYYIGQVEKQKAKAELKEGYFDFISLETVKSDNIVPIKDEYDLVETAS